MAGVLEFIPVAGWITALITIATVGMLTHSHWIWMAALLGLWRMLMILSETVIRPSALPRTGLLARNNFR